MFKVGELVVYSVHGVCEIDDICEKTYGGKTRTYYVLHPIDDLKLRINIPVKNSKVVILKMLDKTDAEKLMESFSGPGVDWIDDVKQRNKQYKNAVQSGDREEITKIAITLMRKSHEAKINKKHISDHDKKLLSKIKTILFEELALALNTTNEAIEERVRQELNYQAS
jgi:CarD family transcriptional regulator